MRPVDHDRAYPGGDFHFDVGQFFMMIEMYRERMVPAFRQFCGDGHDITDACVAKGAWRTGDNQRRAQFCGGFHHHLQCLQVVDVKRRHSIAFLLRLL
ncbi:hypothetical protein NGUA11_04172 [Salmonella enterica]|nr:hypothetical protein NGUA11_04172 [Salmonella enterica]